MGKYINIIIACNCKSDKFLNFKQAQIFHIKAKHKLEQQSQQVQYVYNKLFLDQLKLLQAQVFMT